MTPIPEVSLAPLAPIAFAGIGAMVVLMGEVLLTRAGLSADLLVTATLILISHLGTS